MMTSPSFQFVDAAIREAVGKQGFMKLVGAKIDELAHGRAVMSLERRDEVLQQHGFFHGGVIAFLVDNATTVAAGTLADRSEGSSVLTAEYKLNFTAPARGQKIVCEAIVLKPGRRMSVVEAKVFSHEDGEPKLCAVALATIAITEAKAS
jgi:uncharacterized protein (TIGR00369 family)